MTILRHNPRIVKLLAVSDQVVERVYSLASEGHFGDVDLILGCGDLPYTYLEYLLTVLNRPLCYVPGNHDPAYSPHSPAAQVEGGWNLDGRTVLCKGLLVGGLGGSIRYRPDGVNQHSQRQAQLTAWRMLPGLMWNRLRHGRPLDILISHSPPFGIHDEDSQAHQGLRALNWLLGMARPRLHLHGHTHFYRQNLAPSETQWGPTRICNVYPYKVIEI